MEAGVRVDGGVGFGSPRRGKAFAGDIEDIVVDIGEGGIEMENSHPEAARRN